MSRFLRQIVVVVLLILYGSVALCGSGLHALTDSGIAHSSSDRGDEGKVPTLQGVSGHCPICEFQAQGQLATATVPVVSRPHTALHVALLLALVATRDPHPSCARGAPPSDSATVA